MRRREFLSVAGAALASPVSAAARPPNVVLIYADDVGYGDLSFYGATQVKTPNLDRLAAAGLQFSNAHATSATCTPSRYSMLTGEYAWRKPGTGVLPGDAALIIPAGTPTVASVMKSKGYKCGVVGKWHLGLGNGKVDWNQEITPGPRELGFDYSFLIPATGDRVPCVYVENGRVANLDPADPIQVSYKDPFPGEPTGKGNPELLKMHPSHGHDQTIVNGVSRIGYMKGGKKALWVDEDMAGTITGKAEAFLEREKAGPFFLYFATHDIHVPRMPNSRFVGKTGMGPRGDSIAELDWSVGRILDKLDQLGLAKNTLVMFSSDNGPVVDDGYQDQAVEKLNGHRPAGRYRGGKYSNFDGGTRIPLLARWPGQIRKDTRSEALVSQVDLLATMAALVGQPVPAGASPDGVNVLPALLGKSKTARTSVVEHAGVLSLVEGNWKVIEGGKGARVDRNTATELGNEPTPQLYDIKLDPGETTNRAAEYPEVVARMLGELGRIRGAPR